MYDPYPGSGVAARDVREYARVFRWIDGERLELAAFAVRRGAFPACDDAEAARHKAPLRDLAELEELLTIRTGTPIIRRIGGCNSGSGGS